MVSNVTVVSLHSMDFVIGSQLTNVLIGLELQTNIGCSQVL